jgi:hypothetical protein
MKETVRQYTRRIAGYSEGKDPLTILKSTPKRVERLLAKVPGRALVRRPARGKWSLAEILAHLAEGEIVFGYRVRMVASKNRTPIQAFDQDVWQKNAMALRHDPVGAFELFSVLRSQNVAFLKSLPRATWAFYGRHEERGRETLERMARLYAGHDLNHLRQIQDLAAAKRVGPARRGK